MTIAYLNNEFLPLENAKISVMDRGFLFGDGIYEVVPVYNGKLFRLSEHLKRLYISLKHIQLSIAIEINEWRSILEKLVKQNGAGDQFIYLQITRGVTPTRNHAFPSDPQPTLFAFSMPGQQITKESLRQGLKAITLADSRWKFCHIKAITLLANILLYQCALQENANDSILIDENGHALEGTASNLFIVKDNVIITHPKCERILGGITRDLILELAEINHMPYKEQFIPEEQLHNADEIWLTSSTKQIKPVIELDGESIGNGKPGPVWEQMIRHYQTAIANNHNDSNC